MCLSLVSAVVCVVIFRGTGKRLRKFLEQEYGRCHK